MAQGELSGTSGRMPFSRHDLTACSDVLSLSSSAGLSDEPVIQELLLRTSEIFHPIESPEHRIHWLQRLAQFHGMRGNLAEVACTQVGAGLELAWLVTRALIPTPKLPLI